jgi:hypothetical protein
MLHSGRDTNKRAWEHRQGAGFVGASQVGGGGRTFSRPTCGLSSHCCAPGGAGEGCAWRSAARPTGLPAVSRCRNGAEHAGRGMAGGLAAGAASPYPTPLMYMWPPGVDASPYLGAAHGLMGGCILLPCALGRGASGLGVLCDAYGAGLRGCRQAAGQGGTRATSHPPLLPLA